MGACGRKGVRAHVVWRTLLEGNGVVLRRLYISYQLSTGTNQVPTVHSRVVNDRQAACHRQIETGEIGKWDPMTERKGLSV